MERKRDGTTLIVGSHENVLVHTNEKGEVQEYECEDCGETAQSSSDLRSEECPLSHV